MLFFFLMLDLLFPLVYYVYLISHWKRLLPSFKEVVGGLGVGGVWLQLSLLFVVCSVRELVEGDWVRRSTYLAVYELQANCIHFGTADPQEHAVLGGGAELECDVYVGSDFVAFLD